MVPEALALGVQLRIDRVAGAARLVVELYYEEHGSGDPLLCIMGFATDLTGWLMQTPEFAKSYRTIVFDNRGVGRSAKPPGPYTIHEMADDAVGILEALDVERAHVLGLSMGGMIAQEVALRHPQRVRGLVLAARFPSPTSRPRSSGNSSSRRWAAPSPRRAR